MMEVLTVALIALGIVLLMMGFFFAGVITANRLTQKSRADAEYWLRKMYAYRDAGVKNPGDPLPYVAPPVRQWLRAPRKLPHIKELDRRLRAGGRGTVKITNEDA